MGTPRRKIRLVRVITHPMSATFLLRDQLRYLERNGFQVTLMSLPGSELQGAGEREGVSWVPVTLPDDVFLPDRGEELDRIVAELERLEPDLVHASIGRLAYPVLLAAERVGVPVKIYHLNALTLETAEGPLRDALRHAEEITYALADRVLCVSPSLQRRYRELGLDPAGKSRVLGKGSSNGVDVARFKPAAGGEAEEIRERHGVPGDAKIVGWVGRLAQVKGIPDLVEAFDSVLERHPDAFLLMVGGPDPFTPVPVELVERLRGHPRIRLTGYVDDTSPYYRAMDVLAFPSRREGLPNVVLEAAASGLPVVGYRVTGLVDAVLDGVTGRLLEPGDAGGLGDAVCEYLADPAASERDGSRGRERVVREFPRERVWADLRTFLNDLVAEPGRAEHRG